MAEYIKNMVVVSDIHAGCRMALCPPDGVSLDGGGIYLPSDFQNTLHKYWEEFWYSWVPMVTRNEPYALVVNGDCVDGVHHKSTTQISHDLEDQAEIAYALLEPIVDSAEAYYHLRGTEAHVGQSGVEEERLAKRLGAIPNDEGQFARHDLWIRIGSALCHILHHVGTTSAQAYEATAVHKELVEEYNEAARTGNEPPDIVIRSHRHRMIQTTVPTSRGEGIAITTPGWQGKTPFVWRVAGGRIATPQFGGLLVRQGDEEFFVRRKVWTIERTKAECPRLRNQNG